MNNPFLSTHLPAPPVRLRTGLLFLGASVVTVAVVGWGVARATAQVVSLEVEHGRSNARLAHMEKVIGGFPTTVADTVHAAATSALTEGE